MSLEPSRLYVVPFDVFMVLLLLFLSYVGTETENISKGVIQKEKG